MAQSVDAQDIYDDQAPYDDQELYEGQDSYSDQGQDRPDSPWRNRLFVGSIAILALVSSCVGTLIGFALMGVLLDELSLPSGSDLHPGPTATLVPAPILHNTPVPTDVVVLTCP